SEEIDAGNVGLPLRREVEIGLVRGDDVEGGIEQKMRGRQVVEDGMEVDRRRRKGGRCPRVRAPCTIDIFCRHCPLELRLASMTSLPRSGSQAKFLCTPRSAIRRGRIARSGYSRSC